VKAVDSRKEEEIVRDAINMKGPSLARAGIA
jgi:hypothetical protein